jgi:hypothetical protein
MRPRKEAAFVRTSGRWFPQRSIGDASKSHILDCGASLSKGDAVEEFDALLPPKLGDFSLKTRRPGGRTGAIGLASFHGSIL